MVRSLIELDPHEIGKLWQMKESVRFHFIPDRFLTTPPDYCFDRDSVIMNLDSWLPSLFHDRAWGTRRWDDGQKITYMESNRYYRDLILAKGSHRDRKRANLYYRGLCILGYPVWIKGKIFGKREPIYVPDDNVKPIEVII